MSRPAPHGRAVTRVVVGVLQRDDGRVLLADRPAGKPYAGFWEFPGGKIEPGELVAAALKRELLEELGIDVGPSTPWVTFEFDYPHAHVELQFRLVNRWHGEPHAREGQRLLFVDPAGDLPQPLLPAAVPALRWLLLPRTVLVIAPAEAAAVAAHAAPSHRAAANGESRIVVIDANWNTETLAALSPVLGKAESGTQSWLMASGAGARRAEGWAGLVLEVGALGEVGESSVGWQGAWVDSEHDLRFASSRGCDFVLVRSAAAADALQVEPAALPVFFPSPSCFAGDGTRGAVGHGRWIDLRPTAVADKELSLPA